MAMTNILDLISRILISVDLWILYDKRHGFNSQVGATGKFTPCGANHDHSALQDPSLFFFRWLFADLIPEKDAESYIAGLILLGAAPCTAMVFVWSHLTNGDANYTLVQVSLNDVIMVFAFAPIVAFLLGVTDIPVPWETLLLSVGLYVVVPLVAGVLTRSYLTNQLNGDVRLEQFNTLIKPYSIVALLGTVVLLFGFQGEKNMRL